MATTDPRLTSAVKIGAAPQNRQVLDSIAQALAGLHFGSIEIVVHEGKVTQIERKEKFRLTA